MSARLTSSEASDFADYAPFHERRVSERSRSRRGKNTSVLLSADHDGTLTAVLDQYGLSFACGGGDTGGADASKLLSDSFSNLDSSVIELQGQYKTAERIVLSRGGRVVAAAVLHVHSLSHIHISEPTRPL